MILGIFFGGMATGICLGVLIFYIIFREDLKALNEFNKRQEKYKEMI